MKTQISLDIHLSILKRVGEFGRITYQAKVVVGERILSSEPETEEVFWCCASGRNLFDCCKAIREHALCWIKSQLITEVTGLTDSETLPVTLNTEENHIDIKPVTYNDWFLDAHLL